MASILIIGPSKTGKTRSMSTLPGTLFVAEVDTSGEKSLRRKIRYFEAGDAEQIASEETNLKADEVAVIRYLSEVSSITKGFLLDAKYLQRKRIFDLFVLDLNFLLKDDTIKNICIDTLTGFSNLAKSACFSGSGTKGPVWKDWDLFAEKVLEVVTACQGRTDKNLVVASHIETEKDAITEAINEIPLAEGKKIPRIIMQEFDIIYRTIYRDGQYLWRTKPTETMQSIGNRLVDGDDLPDYIKQDFSKLLSALPK